MLTFMMPLSPISQMLTSMKINNYSPDIWGAILILGSLFILQVIVAVVFQGMGIVFISGDPKAWMVSVLAYAIFFSAYMRITSGNFFQLFHLSSNSVTSTVALSFIPLVIVMLGAYWWLSDFEYYIASLFPVDPYSQTMLLNFMRGGWLTVLMICVIGPLLEEVLFRGILLRGFISHYPPLVAIIASSLLFALVHFNMYQIPGAFVVGCFFSWLYYISRSLWPCLIAHSLSNLSAYIFYLQSPETFLTVTDVTYNNVVVNLFTVILSGVGVFYLYRIFRSPRPVVR
jgi:CAAX protease family protein